MSYIVVHDDGRTLVATDRPVVKARERSAFDSALALLDHLHGDADRQRREAEATEQAARERGYADGLAAGRATFTDAIARIAEQAAAHRRMEEEEVAALALKAVAQIAGELGDARMMQGVAARAVKAVMAQGDVVVEVAPAIAAELEAHLAQIEGGSAVTIRPDPQLGERQCRVTGPDSRIIADLDRQLGELAERWGAAAREAEHVD